MTTSAGERWIDRWNRYWFPPSSTLNLACCRILAVAAQLFWFFPSLDYQINLLSKNPRFIDPQPIIRAITLVVPRDVFFTPAVFTALHRITFAAGLLALVGLFTRTSLFVLALGIWILVGHAYSYADLHHPEALFAIFLMILPLSPAGDRLSLDAVLRRRRAARAGAPPRDRAVSDTAMWPLKLVHVLLSMTYFSTGITKLLSGGLAWMNGYTVAIYTFGDAIQRHKPLGIWVAQHHTLCVLLGVGTIAFETFFFVSLFVPRLAPLFFLSGILFHLGLYVTAGQPFFQHMVLNAMLLLFLDPAWFLAWVSRTSVARAAGLARSPQPS
jgi:hypothetical protein